MTIQLVRGNPDQELGGIRDQGLKNNTHIVKMKIRKRRTYFYISYESNISF